MSQQTTENPGIIRSRSFGSRGIGKHLFLWMLSHPLFVVIYVAFCRNAYKLCMYGGLRRRGTILLGGILFFAIYLILYLCRCRQIRVVTNQEPDLKKVWFYGFHRNKVYLFDKEKGYYEKELSKEEKDFVKLQYAKIPRYRFHFWKVPVCLFLLVATIVTLCGIYNSGQHYNGKLAWILEEVKTSKYISLDHDNLYTDGVQGIFRDIEEKVELPAHLTLNGVFNLHFAPDGTILTFDMMLRGYDRSYEFVDTYLISYPSSRGTRIRVQKGNYAEGQAYDEAKSIEALLVGERWLPYEEIIRDWDEEEYGLYYLGSRTWSQWDENIYSLQKDGSVSPINWKNAYEVSGYSISVFCPNHSEIAPKRYMVGYESDGEQE